MDRPHFKIKNRINQGTGKYIKAWFSHKFNWVAVSYEIAVCIKTADIVWIHGPFPAATHDLSIFRYKLRDMLLPFEMAMTDRGYRGDFRKCLTPYQAQNCQHKRAMAALRGRHKTVNRRFKTFGALTHTFWHSPHIHHIFFQTAAVLIQIAHSNGYSHYDVVGYVDLAYEADWGEGNEH